MKTYNKVIYMPKDKIRRFVGKEYSLSFSHHAKLSCLNDKYGLIKPVNKIKIIESMIVELYLNEFLNPFKLLLRSRYSHELDVCLVVLPDDLKAIVKTIWLCKSVDNHFTLDKSMFAVN